MSSGRSLVARWDLSVDNPPDLGPRGNRYPGTGANIVGHPNGIAGGRCAEFNGNNSNINVGDIIELNSVEKFTIAFWMNQDVLDVSNYPFYKQAVGWDLVTMQTLPGGDMVAYIGSPRGTFDYSTVIQAGAWHHIVMVFDGALTGNAERLKVYVDGQQQTLAFPSGNIPSATPDMSGGDFTIGRFNTTLDGELDEFMIFDAALTQLQVIDLYERTRKGIY